MKADKTIVKAWVKAQGRASRSRTAIAFLIGLLSTLMGLLQAWALARTLACVLTLDVESVGPMIGLFIIVCAARIALSMLQDIASTAAGIHARRRLRGDVLKRILAEGPALLRRHHSAAIAGILVDRIDALDGYFARWLPASSLWLVSQWIVVVAVYLENRTAGLILACCCAVLPIFQAVFGIATAVASRRQFLAMGRLQTRFLDRVKGIATIVLSGGSDREAEALASSADDLRRRTMTVLRIAFIASATTDVAMVLALVLIVVSQAHLLTGHPSNAVLTRALYAVLLVPEAFASFRALSAAYQDRAQASAAAEAMHDLASLSDAGDNSTHVPRSHGGLSVAVEHVSFAWSEERGPVLHDINFHMPAGGTLILEGASGAGKSTLIELLLGFVAPSEGRILFGGQDVASLSPKQISSLIGWIGQKPVLFAGTIRENILFARPDASDADLQRAVEAASIDKYLAALPEGLDTRIGEGGFGLSGGQAQRVAIARAYLKDAPLLLLDEPTSHLDPATEADILDSLKTLAAGRTVILCSHSQQAREFHGSHLVLDAGRAVSLTGEAA